MSLFCCNKFCLLLIVSDCVCLSKTIPRFIIMFTMVVFTIQSDCIGVLGYVSHRYNKPLQSSVRAVTSGTLWALRREDFRGILMSEFSNLASLKLLRSVDLLSRLTILQLSHIADSLLELPFSDGQTIANKVHLLFSTENLVYPVFLFSDSSICICRMKLS